MTPSLELQWPRTLADAHRLDGEWRFMLLIMESSAFQITHQRRCKLTETISEVYNYLFILIAGTKITINVTVINPK